MRERMTQASLARKADALRRAVREDLAMFGRLADARTHDRERHVATPTARMLDELLSGRGETVCHNMPETHRKGFYGRFADERELKGATIAAIYENAEKIVSWLEDPAGSDKLALYVNAADVSADQGPWCGLTSDGHGRGQIAWAYTSRACVVLRRSPDAKYGFMRLTAYPVDDGELAVLPDTRLAAAALATRRAREGSALERAVLAERCGKDHAARVAYDYLDDRASVFFPGGAARLAAVSRRDGQGRRFDALDVRVERAGERAARVGSEAHLEQLLAGAPAQARTVRAIVAAARALGMPLAREVDAAKARAKAEAEAQAKAEAEAKAQAKAKQKAKRKPKAKAKAEAKAAQQVAGKEAEDDHQR